MAIIKTLYAYVYKYIHTYIHAYTCIHRSTLTEEDVGKMVVIKTLQQDVSECKERTDKMVKDAEEEKTRVNGAFDEIKEKKADKSDLDFKINGVTGEITLVKSMRSGDVQVCIICLYMVMYVYMYSVHVHVYVHVHMYICLCMCTCIMYV
jgi:hypothetical protein